MPIAINQTSTKRKNVKARRVKGHQRLFIKPVHDLSFKSPDQLLIDKIINNIKQEMKGEK